MKEYTVPAKVTIDEYGGLTIVLVPESNKVVDLIVESHTRTAYVLMQRNENDKEHYTCNVSTRIYTF